MQAGLIDNIPYTVATFLAPEVIDENILQLKEAPHVSIHVKFPVGLNDASNILEQPPEHEHPEHRDDREQYGKILALAR